MTILAGKDRTGVGGAEPGVIVIPVFTRSCRSIAHRTPGREQLPSLTADLARADGAQRGGPAVS